MKIVAITIFHPQPATKKISKTKYVISVLTRIDWGLIVMQD